MNYGIGTTMTHYHRLEVLEIPYIELPGNQIAQMSEEEFQSVCQIIQSGKVKCCGFNAAFPADIALCGADFDLDRALSYFEGLCQRGKQLEISAIGVGSPKSRHFQMGEDVDAAWAQMEAFLTAAADIAAQYGIIVMYESLNRQESHLGVSLREGVDLVKRLNRPNLKLVFDIYHLHMEGEPLTVLTYALPYIHHVHIAERAGEERRYPSFAMFQQYKTIFAMLREGGYQGIVCTEAFDGDVTEGAQRFLRIMKRCQYGLKIGCVADDFTGASDAASFLLAQGLKTVLCNGVSQANVDEYEAVVVALKSRTQETAQAVEDSRVAFDWLVDQGAEHLYFKYCSTFDSTRAGNIGPVTDMLLEHYETPYTILSPALPVNGRTVKKGVLYVDGVPLAETSMKNHPLTPMWDSNIGVLMEEQGKYDTLFLDYEQLEQSVQEIQRTIATFGENRSHFYIVPDYLSDAHGEKVAELFSHCPVLTGGSGILVPLARRYAQGITASSLDIKTPGRGLILAGSCSKATLAQIASFQQNGAPSYRIDPIKLMEGTVTVEHIWAFVQHHQNQSVLVYSSDTAENVRETQKIGRETIANRLEETAALLAQRAVAEGYTRIIVAGGETSSAVVKGLGYDSFAIGESVAPGVPIMAPLSNLRIRLVLKSGNFGQPDFFQRALHMTEW